MYEPITVIPAFIITGSGIRLLINTIASLFFALLFISSLVTFVTNVVAEKEKKIKERQIHRIERGKKKKRISFKSKLQIKHINIFSIKIN